MNVLFVNPVHPSTPHISAVRAWRFAKELSSRGHRVVFVTAWRNDQTPHVNDTIESHDWREPLTVACRDAREAVQASGLLRKPVTAASLFLHGGRHGVWVRDAVRAAAGLKPTFAPDIVWCTFGMLASVFAAKRIAARARCPWVLDVKDNWELYVPYGMRRFMAWRTRGWAAMTANARLTANVISKYLKAAPSVIYSGVEQDFYRDPSEECGPRSEFVLNLIGSVYFPARLREFLRGVNNWMTTLPEQARAQVVVRYFGADGEIVKAVASCDQTAIRLDVVGYVSAPDLARYCKAAAVNAYIGFPWGFHHKLLELLACARPVLAFPAESVESMELALSAGGELRIASSADAVARTLAEVHDNWSANVVPVKSSVVSQRYAWPNQAVELERVLVRAAHRPGAKH